MSSSRGRYQSRFLSFLSQQSMQWRDRTLRTFRQAKLTVTWGVQMVLYPVYLLFQSGRLVGQQIRAAVNRFVPLLEAVKDDDFDPAVGVPPLNPDAPLQNVLDCLDTFDLPIIISPTALPKSRTAKSLRGRGRPPALGSCHGQRGGAIAQVSAPSKLVPFAPSPQVDDLSAEVAQPGTIIRMGKQGMMQGGRKGDRLQYKDADALSNGFNGTAYGVAVHDAENQPMYLAQTVRGFASLLATRSLVLVDTQNQILDILTYEQQVTLYQRIVYEVAGYYRDRNLRLRAQGRSLQERWQFLSGGRPPQSLDSHSYSHSYSHSHSHSIHLRRTPHNMPQIQRQGAWRFLPPPKQKDTMAAPVRLFRRVMEWMQTSPIAVSANVFQEAALVQGVSGSALPPIPPPIFPGTSVGTSLGMSPGKPAGMSPGMSTVKVPRAIAPGHDIPMRRPFWQGWMRALGLTGSGTPSSSPQPTSSTESVAPTNHDWFDPDHQGSSDGWLNANQFSQMRQHAERFLSMPSLPFRNRWISNWDEPIQGSDSIMSSPIQPTDAVDAKTDADRDQPSSSLVSSNRGTVRRYGAAAGYGAVGYGAIASVARSGDAAETDHADIDYEDTLLSPSHPQWDEAGGELFSSIDPANREGAMSTTLVDTKATLVGYVKHPLEQVLEWIDLGMLWIEDLAAKAWNWMTRVLK